MRIAYVRVSTEEQNEARQREALESYNIEKWYCEKRSAKDTNRPQLEAMLAFARSGDVIYIHDFSRLARNTQDLLELVQRMQQKELFFWKDKKKELPLQRENIGIRDVREYRSLMILNSYLKNTKSMKLVNLKLQDN